MKGNQTKETSSTFLSDCDSVKTMKENRFSYLFIIFTVILLGLLSRKFTSVPLFVGDLLYAVMIYFGIRFLFIHQESRKSGMIALIICYCIELLQLYDAGWMVALRDTIFGRYVLGQGFLWSDIIAYTFGTIIAHYLDKVILKKSTSRN